MEPAWLFDSFAPLLGGLVGVLVGIYGYFGEVGNAEYMMMLEFGANK